MMSFQVCVCVCVVYLCMLHACECVHMCADDHTFVYACVHMEKLALDIFHYHFLP